MAKAAITMDDLLSQESLGNLSTGETINGKVLSLKKHEALIDLGAHGVGLVPRREIGFNRNLKEGDDVTASVIEPELDSGYSLLSLRKAAKDKGWDDVIEAKEDSRILELKPYDANRGG